MANFVLVHGAWHGAWCWGKVLPALIQWGHRAHAVTLTGLGERAHLLSPTINLSTHINDVRLAIEAEEMTRPILVVHSYAGMIGTAIADIMPEGLSHIVFVDAVVPNPGESWSSTHASTTRTARMKAAQADSLFSFPAPTENVFGLDEKDFRWTLRRYTRHPATTYTDTIDFSPERVGSVPRTFINCTKPPLPTIDVIRSRIADPHFWGGHWAKNAQVINMPTGHDPMISAPNELVTLLQTIAKA